MVKIQPNPQKSEIDSYLNRAWTDQLLNDKMSERHRPTQAVLIAFLIPPLATAYLNGLKRSFYICLCVWFLCLTLKIYICYNYHISPILLPIQWIILDFPSIYLYFCCDGIPFYICAVSLQMGPFGRIFFKKIDIHLQVGMLQALIFLLPGWIYNFKTIGFRNIV